MNLLKFKEFTRTMIFESSKNPLVLKHETFIKKITNNFNKDIDVFLINETSKSLTFKVVTTAATRITLTSFINNEIKKDFSIIPTNRPLTDIKFNDGQYNILIKVKPNRMTINVDPNEAMVCCLLAMNKFNIPNDDDDLDDIITNALEYKDMVIGANPNIFNFFEMNYVNLIQAISATIAIKQKITSKIENIYLTGGKFPADIKFLAKSYLGMKDYNSSDIILKCKDKYIGISLKKQKTENDSPTLLNKSIATFFDSDTKLQDKLTNASNDFFNKVVKSYDSTFKPIGDEWRKYIGKVPNDFINAKLKSIDNEYFKIIYDEFSKYDNHKIFEIFSLIFKTDIKSLLTGIDFEFYLVNGVGDYNPTSKSSGIKLGIGHAIEINTINTYLNELKEKDAIKIVQTQNKKNAFDKDATTAKVFFTIECNNTPFINLEIRYKGNFKNQPQIQAYITPDFYSILEH